MAEKNWTHLFIDGRRVSVDRRDNSVSLFPDESFRMLLREHIGFAEGSGRDWRATAPDGTSTRVTGRKAAAEWLIAQTEHERAQRAAAREHAGAKADAATAEALAIIRTVRPDYPAPQPLMGNPDAPTFFVFEPEELRDLLQRLRAAP